MKNSATKILLLISLCLAGSSLSAQHFIGASAGYSINTLSSSIYEDFRSMKSWKNYGLVYKYYAGKWVGIQTGFNYTEKGFQGDSTYVRRYQVVEIPFVSQFHYEVWKLRAIANAGLYAAYSISAENTFFDLAGGPNRDESYTFQSTDRRFDYGLRLGAGVGVMLQPVEILLEFNYSIGFGYIHKPVNPPQITTYNRLSQMIFSLCFLIAL
jgi:hypothetical protein